MGAGPPKERLCTLEWELCVVRWNNTSSKSKNDGTHEF